MMDGVSKISEYVFHLDRRNVDRESLIPCRIYLLILLSPRTHLVLFGPRKDFATCSLHKLVRRDSALLAPGEAARLVHGDLCRNSIRRPPSAMETARQHFFPPIISCVLS